MKLTLSQPPRPTFLTIGALAAASGLAASAIRYWERAGVLPAPPRQGGQRRYPRAALAQLAILRLAQSCGFTLEEMRRLVQGFRGGSPSQRWRSMATAKRAELEAKIRELQSMRKILKRLLHCECLEWSQCDRLATQMKTQTRAKKKAQR